MLSQAAEDAGVTVNIGCGEGQCGACEVEIKKDGGECEAFVVRSCVTPIPPQELICQGEHWHVLTDFDTSNLW
jgi:ferredoxin